MKKKITLCLLVLLSVLLIFTSCSSKQADFFDVTVTTNGESMKLYNSSAQDTAEEMYFDMPMADAEAEYEYGEDGVGYNTVTQSAVSQRKIIYSSNYHIRTKDYDTSVANLSLLCEKYGAYFESANTYGGYDGRERSSNYTIRVPVANYKLFTGEAESLGVVISSSENNKDITEQYYDTEARLESAKIREERVLEILKNAHVLDDVLVLERELSDIRYEIESYTGALRKYDSLVNYSTVTISLSETSDAVIPKSQVLTFGERLKKGFLGGIEDFTDSFQDFVVLLSYNFIGIVIWGIIIVIVVFVLLKNAKKRKARKNRNSVKNNESESSEKDNK